MPTTTDDEPKLYTRSDMTRAIQRRLAQVKSDSAPRAVLDAALARIAELERQIAEMGR